MAFEKSPEVKAAIKLVKKGLTAYAAAKKSGCTPGALYKSGEYKSIMAAKKAAAK